MSQRLLNNKWFRLLFKYGPIANLSAVQALVGEPLYTNDEPALYIGDSDVDFTFRPVAGQQPVTVVDDDYDALLTDYIIAVSVGNKTITLPDPADALKNKAYVVQDIFGNASGDPITIDTAAGDINGIGSIQITSDYGRLDIFTDGTDWFAG